MPPQHSSINNPNSILSELEAHNDFFDTLVDMIPSKVYISGNSGGDDSHNLKYKKGQQKETKEGKWARSKAAKFDLNQQESTREEKKRLEQQEADASDDDNDLGNIEFEVDDDEEMDVDVEGGKTADAKQKKKGKDKNSSGKNSHQSRIEDLKLKLRAKLEQRQTEKVLERPPDTVISKRAARRAEKKRRIEAAKKKQAQDKVQGGLSHTTSAVGKTKIKLIPELGGSKIVTPTEPQNVVDDLSGIDFGGIAGLKNGLLMKGNYSSHNKSLKNMGKKKSLERLLEEAEAKKEKLRQLKQSNDLEDKQKAKKMEWGDTLKAASGEHTRTSDPALLKKALKRKSKKKTKSQEAWRSRNEQTKAKMDDRQNVRNHNIKQRAVGGDAGANLSSKRIKDDENGGDTETPDKRKRPRLGPHSGKARAGFEGKKQDFINKGKKAQ